MIKKRYLPLVISLITSNVLFAQITTWNWARSLPYDKTSSQNLVNSTMDNKGNTYVLSTLAASKKVTYPNGVITGVSGNYVLSKIDASGTVKWGVAVPKPAIGTFQSNDLFQTMAVNNRGDVYFVYHNESSAVTSKVFGYDLVPGAALVKLDSTGKIISIKNIVKYILSGNLTDYRAFCTAIKTVGDTAIVVAGVASGGQGYLGGNLPIANKTATSRAFIGVIDSAGVGKYGRYLTSTNIDLVEAIKHIDVDDSLNVYVAGRVHWFAGAKIGANERVEDFQQPKGTGYAAFVAKYKYRGDVTWLKYIHVKAVNSEERSFDVNGIAYSKSNASLYVVGNSVDTTYYDGVAFRESRTSLDAYLLSVNAYTGGLTWKVTVDTKNIVNASNSDEFFGVVANSTGQPVVAGFSSNYYVRAYQVDGSPSSELTQGSFYTLYDNYKLHYANGYGYRWGANFTKSTYFGSYFVGSNTNSTSLIIPVVAAFELAPPVQTGVQDQTVANETSFMVYPNPTSGVLTLTGIEIGENIELYHISGKSLGQQKYSGSIDLSIYPEGMYVVKTSKGVAKAEKVQR